MDAICTSAVTTATQTIHRMGQRSLPPGAVSVVCIPSALWDMIVLARARAAGIALPEPA